DLVGFIGLGKMGKPMAGNLCKKGAKVAAFDIDPTPVRELVALGASGSSSIADVSRRSDVIFTMLPDSPIVERVVTGTEGIIASAKPGSVIVDMSTIDPRVTDRLAEAAAERGINFVDAPVGRLASHAERGESLFMVGAAPDVFDRVKPLLEMMGTT